MKILFCGGQGAAPLRDWLAGTGEDVCYTEEKLVLADMIERKFDLIVSYNYRHIIRKDVIELLNGRAVNLHISYLPYNRGAHPNLWSFLEGTPSGVTIHYIDEGVDTGDIIAQKIVAIDEEAETLKSSYERLHVEIQSLFKEKWPDIKTGAIAGKRQIGTGTVHFRKDFSKVERLMADKGWDISVAELKRRYSKALD